MQQLIRASRALVSTWRGRFIVAFLAAQLLIPLHYYLLRRDPHDERYAWRMFSPTRMVRCRATFEIDNQPVNLGAEFHEAWLTMVERGRVVVIEQMARRLCEEHPGKAVDVTLQCKYLDKPPATYGGFDLCTRPLL